MPAEGQSTPFPSPTPGIKARKRTHACTTLKRCHAPAAWTLKWRSKRTAMVPPAYSTSSTRTPPTHTRHGTQMVPHTCCLRAALSSRAMSRSSSPCSVASNSSAPASCKRGCVRGRRCERFGVYAAAVVLAHRLVRQGRLLAEPPAIALGFGQHGGWPEGVVWPMGAML